MKISNPLFINSSQTLYFEQFDPHFRNPSYLYQEEKGEVTMAMVASFKMIKLLLLLINTIIKISNRSSPAASYVYGWSRVCEACGRGREALIASPFPCCSMGCECSRKKTQIEKKNEWVILLSCAIQKRCYLLYQLPFFYH